MRELIGKIKQRGVIQEVYRSEHVMCRECQRTVPMGIEVITVQFDGITRKVLKHACYCQPHGLEYRAQADGGR